MIAVEKFYESLKRRGVDFFTGVPDSLLKDICAYITEQTPADRHIITANEGGAVALGTGYHLGTGKVPLVYMQNSGIGNAINPLLSLADKEVYGIPMLLMIGWRGEPGVKDEPQHIKQGKVLTGLLESMSIPYVVLEATSDYESIIDQAYQKTIELQTPVAILVRKGTFSSFKLQQEVAVKWEMSREAALREVLSHIPNAAAVVSTTGMLSRELFEIREQQQQSHATDFLTVGSMGHTLPIAMGIAMAQPQTTVYCLDGDGSALMHLGSYAIAGATAPKNLRVIIFNNGAHDSVGGQPTVGHSIHFEAIAKGFNIRNLGAVEHHADIEVRMKELNASDALALLEIKIKKGARADLGRPTDTPQKNKEALMAYLKNA